jgi:hypothetical protein
LISLTDYDVTYYDSERAGKDANIKIDNDITGCFIGFNRVPMESTATQRTVRIMLPSRPGWETVVAIVFFY